MDLLVEVNMFEYIYSFVTLFFNIFELLWIIIISYPPCAVTFSW